MTVVVACYAKAVDQLLELRNFRIFRSSLIEDDPIINNDPGMITEKCYNKALWHHTCRYVAEKKQVKQTRVEEIKRHDEERLLAIPVKTWQSLANFNCPTTGNGPSWSADLSKTGPCLWSHSLNSTISTTCGNWATLPQESSSYHCFLICRLFGSWSIVWLLSLVFSLPENLYSHDWHLLDISRAANVCDLQDSISCTYDTCSLWRYAVSSRDELLWQLTCLLQ